MCFELTLTYCESGFSLNPIIKTETFKGIDEDDVWEHFYNLHPCAVVYGVK